ncbi:MAG: hypothetical protein P857_411 [Candidatus Xenolissoclinum pacificiensis L6]|uniref:Uncharacterized protein n=1 Tax=Candidatus Xenolissoclinum pacificiensis L6 TaxID=1401685 RepID=W2V0W5_9RICK|nr:MAG: hypothetical protein P857_411 [Candidatus Xenolissoclinum pacificiensis L6]
MIENDLSYTEKNKLYLDIKEVSLEWIYTVFTKTKSLVDIGSVLKATWTSVRNTLDNIKFGKKEDDLSVDRLQNIKKNPTT